MSMLATIRAIGTARRACDGGAMGIITKNRLTRRKWHRIRGLMIAAQPSWARHLRAIPYGSPEMKKAVESRSIDVEPNAAL